MLREFIAALEGKLPPQKMFQCFIKYVKGKFLSTGPRPTSMEPQEGGKTSWEAHKWVVRESLVS